MNVSVLVPYRADGGHRDAAWAWAAERWKQQHPDWQVVTGTCPDGPWRKGVAVADAASRADGDVVVVADADVWSDGIGAAVDAVLAGAPWAIPHGRVHRLSETATAQVLAGADPKVAAEAIDGLARTPYLGVEGGGLVVLPAEALARVPMDPRFAGWGQDDQSWALALGTILGKRHRGAAPLYHLWHPPLPRLNSHVGSPESHALHVRYQYAARSRPAMRALLAEIT